LSEPVTLLELVSAIQRVDAELSRRAKQAVNVSLTLRNWLIGAYIDEYELAGADRSEYYGQGLLLALSDRLRAQGIRGVGQRQLYKYLTFFRAYPDILPSLTANSSRLSPSEVLPSLTATSLTEDLGLLQKLSFTHFEQLFDLDNPAKRLFYQEHCLRGSWSVRELKRQIASLYYERTALSTDKAQLESQVSEKAAREPADFPIRDPYVFEFLGLKPAEVMGESALEDALLDKLQEFMLELGHGFCFEARQKRLLIGDTYFFVDLVFYHRILKCHVLIELKVGPFTHEHIGQLNTYVSWYAENEGSEGDNPPIGLLLCTEKDQTVVKYALAGMSNQLFVSKYQVALPTEAEIQNVFAEVGPK